MKVTKIAFGYSYTVQIRDNDYVKVSHDAEAELLPGETVEKEREGLAQSVVDFVSEKMTELLSVLR